ncbi:MAG: SusC/RagA family TonB-linked outer membrane protein, partial [Dysgonamonadaceae bacterium]|nr:SusC/RagA family TonB-linked outer membrane protein [Dysgonamonadaceae bacterium]
ISVQTLVIKYLGKQDQEVEAASDITVTLLPSESALDEVIVVAYGTAKKSSFAGSASVIKGGDLEKMQSSNLTKSLEGKVAGLETTSGSGQPGAAASVIIRGLGSISASRSPLIIVDGVPYEGSLNSISSFDIEALTVLKDAAANSIYGARGSNGVIIITTKKGKSGKVQISFDTRVGANSRGIPTYDVITDAGEYYEMYWESLRNKNLESMNYMEANLAASSSLINGNLIYNVYKDIPNNQLIDPLTGKLNPNATEKKWNDNWLKDPFRNGLRQEYNVSVSSGTESTDVYASLSYLDDKGYVSNSDFNRVSARLKVEQKIGEYVKVGGSINYAKTDMNNLTASNTFYSNIFFFGQQIAPIFPIYLYDLNTGEAVLDSKGNKQYDFGETYARPFAAQQNPMATVDAGENKIIVDVVSSRGFFEINFLKNFKFTANIAYDMFNTMQTEYMTPIGGDAYEVGGRGEKQTSRYSALNANQLLNYNRKFDLHSVDVLLGHETKQDSRNYLYGHMTNFINPESSEFSNAARYQDLTSAYLEYALEGYFSRLDYDYDEKYYLTASLRADASSRFHPDVRWGNFWAIGGSWRISQESFLKDVSFIDDLKLRVSYGTQGNDNLLDTDGVTPLWYAYRDLYSVNRVDGEGAMSLTSRGNTELTWEKSNNFNTGFELLAWDNRLSLGFDYFIKETKDLLYQKPIAVSEGLPDFKWVNDIDMENTGVEIELGVDIIKTNDFKWNVNLNATHYKNKLTKLPSDKKEAIEKDGGYQAGSYWRKIGGSIYDFYTYEYAGVDPETGMAQYNAYTKDEEGKEIITKVNVTSDATLRETGKSAIPDLYGGLGTSIDFKGFDFSLQTAFQLGGYVMDGVYQSFMNPGESGTNFHKDMFSRWTPENRNTEIPKLLFENQDQSAVSDRWLTDASYFTIRNITLGYTFPKKLTQSVKLEKLRIYAVSDNVWYVSQRKGLDVRQSFSGAVSYAYSPLRTISLGISANF